MSKGLFSKFNVTAPRVDASVQTEEGQPQSKFMRIGTHDSKIVEVEAPEELMEGRDPTWRSVRIHFENAAGERASHFLEIPTETLEFTGTKKSGGSYTTMTPYNALVNFLQSLGIKEDLGEPKAIASILERFFDPSNIQKLVGSYVTISLGYKNKEVGTDYDRESRVFVLRDSSGETLKDNIGSQLQFPDRSSAEGWARANGHQFVRFPKVTKFRSTNGVDNSAQLSNVKKKFAAFG